VCRSMVDIQSATAEIRRRKKDRNRRAKYIMSASATQGGHKNAQNTNMSYAVAKRTTIIK